MQVGDALAYVPQRVGPPVVPLSQLRTHLPREQTRADRGCVGEANPMQSRPGGVEVAGPQRGLSSDYGSEVRLIAEAVTDQRCFECGCLRLGVAYFSS